MTNGGTNTVAFIALSLDRHRGTAGRVTGLVPTGLYPNAVSVSHDGTRLYVAYGKSPTGPNPLGPWDDAQRATKHPYSTGANNQFALQLTRGGLHAFPVPGEADLARLTAPGRRQRLPHRSRPRSRRSSSSSRGQVKHVVFVVGENRTYDQLLGDVATADGDPKLVHWGRTITPNHHALASTFVTLDRYFCSGGVSGDGWQWTMGGRTTDVAEKAIPVEYAHRGEHTYDWEGLNRGINVGVATFPERLLSNPYTPAGELPGNGRTSPPPKGRDAVGRGARRRGGRRGSTASSATSRATVSPTATSRGCRCWRCPSPRRRASPSPRGPRSRRWTDPYFRGFDMRFPDAWRVRGVAARARRGTWRRESCRPSRSSASCVTTWGPSRTPSTASNTPDTQMADHDWAVGSVVEKRCRARRSGRAPSWRWWRTTRRTAPDHVNAHRTVALLAGPHVRRGAVVHTPCMRRRASSVPSSCSSVCPRWGSTTPRRRRWKTCSPSTPTRRRTRPSSPTSSARRSSPSRRRSPASTRERPRRDAAWWAAATAGFDFDARRRGAGHRDEPRPLLRPHRRPRLRDGVAGDGERRGRVTTSGSRRRTST